MESQHRTSDHTHPGWPSHSKAASSAHWKALRSSAPNPGGVLSTYFKSCPLALWTGRGSAHSPPPTTSQASKSFPPCSNRQPWAQAWASPKNSRRAGIWTADTHWSRPLTRAIIPCSRNCLWVPAAAHRNALHSPGHQSQLPFFLHQMKTSGVGPASEGVASSPREADASPAVRN